MLSRIPDCRFRLLDDDRTLSTLAHFRLSHSTPNSSFLFKLREHLLNDLWLALYLESVQSAKASQALQDPLMNEVKSAIQELAYQPFLLMDIAERFHLNKVQLTRRFRRSFGINPMDYVTQLRIKKARSLLSGSDQTIDRIARSCGYDNGFYFARVFLKHVGLTPSQYRKTHMI
ncbi:AraC family transcriptional regulator [Paenibacillus sp. CC-CFT747]|nr:AraC family transcriptional regulator [Paenibacillus sp. CC-CFT747]